jgi:hypothetical protein
MTKLESDEIVTPVKVPDKYEAGMTYGLTYEVGTTKVTESYTTNTVEVEVHEIAEHGTNKVYEDGMVVGTQVD